VNTLSFPVLVRGFVIAAAIMAAAVHAATARAALLAEADLPGGWTGTDAPGPVASAYAWCPGGAAALPVSPIDRAGRVFSRGSIGQLIYQEVLEFAPGEAQAAFTAVRAHPESCDWADTTADAVPMIFHLGVASELPAGDEAVYRRLEAEWDGMVLSADVVVIRQGQFITVLTHVVTGRETMAVDAGLTRRLAMAAAHKLAPPVATAPER